MPIHDTDDSSQQSGGRHTGVDAVPRRSQRSASPRSALLFEDDQPEDDHPGVSRLYTVAMMADVSEVCRLKTGVHKDGGYTSVFSLAMRMAISFVHVDEAVPESVLAELRRSPDIVAAQLLQL